MCGCYQTKFHAVYLIHISFYCYLDSNLLFVHESLLIDKRHDSAWTGTEISDDSVVDNQFFFFVNFMH